MSRVLDRAFDSFRMPEEHGTAKLAGGILQHGYQCGMIWGAAIAAGAEAFKRFGASPRAEAMAVRAAQRIVESFRAANQDHINCLEITELDKSSTAWDMIVFFLVRGGTIGCFRRAARYAPIAFREIEATLSEEPGSVPEGPVSCAAETARRMGATDEQATMAAGFAGGIGLCGGGCGALGAAIWMSAIKSAIEYEGKADFKDPGTGELVERFLEAAGHEFECEQIVGRKFEGVEDHAGHVRNGGCETILAALTNQ